MKVDKKFSQYSIRSISEEVGFNNVQSFTAAFNKKTGYNPSNYLKNIDKQ